MIILLVLLLRLLVPLFIFKKPLLGGVAALVLDALDWHIFSLLEGSVPANYQAVDKLLDLYYLTFELVIVLRWANSRIKTAGITLFVIRVVGVGIFELLRVKEYLFLFPNVFELFFLYYLVYIKLYCKDWLPSYKKLFLLITILLIIKFIQEYVVHLSGLPYWEITNWWEWGK